MFVHVIITIGLNFSNVLQLQRLRIYVTFLLNYIVCIIITCYAIHVITIKISFS